MTVAINTLAVIPYIGNDTTAVYSITFPTFQNSDVVAYIEDQATGVLTLLVDGVGYALQGIAIPNQNSQITLVDTGQAWMNAGNLTAGYRLLIKFSDNAYQIANLLNLGRFAPKEFGKVMDRLTMHIKASAALIDRSLKFTDQDADAGFDALMPSAQGNGDKILQVNAGATAIEYGPTVGSIFAAEAAAVASAAAALISENAAAASEIAAAASEVAAAASEVAAAASAAAALVSEGAASDSADLSQYYYDLGQFSSQVEVAFGDSPITVTNADIDKLYLVDTTLGDVVFNMPTIVSVSAGFKIATLKVTDQLNDIIINPNGAETLAGLPQRISAQEGVGILVTPNLTLATDWDATFFASGYIVANALGGGGMVINVLQSIAAAGTITPSTDLQQVIKVEGNAGAQVANIVPFSSPPFNGAVITLLGQSAVNTLEIKHNNNAEGCLLNGDAILGLNDSLTLVYDQVAQRFYETSRRIY